MPSSIPFFGPSRGAGLAFYYALGFHRAGIWPCSLVSLACLRHGATEIRRYFPNKLLQITYLNSVVMPDDEDEDEVDDDEEEGSVEVGN